MWIRWNASNRAMNRKIDRRSSASQNLAMKGVLQRLTLAASMVVGSGCTLDAPKVQTRKVERVQHQQRQQAGSIFLNDKNLRTEVNDKR